MKKLLTLTLVNLVCIGLPVGAAAQDCPEGYAVHATYNGGHSCIEDSTCDGWDALGAVLGVAALGASLLAPWTFFISAPAAALAFAELEECGAGKDLIYVYD